MLRGLRARPNETKARSSQCCYQDQTFQDQDQKLQDQDQDHSFQDQDRKVQDQDLASSNKVNAMTKR